MSSGSVDNMCAMPKASSVRDPRLVAYRLPGWSSYPEIVPAFADRKWMDEGTRGWANRCLPLRIANQAGWFVLNDVDVEIIWGGQRSNDSLKILYPSGRGAGLVSSMFGYGIATWSIPYLFQTPPGYDLFVRGPANMPQEACVALDAIVEADWLPFPFTMNWQVTKRLKSIRFERGQPFCMFSPVRRNEIDSFDPVIKNLESDPDLHQRYLAWFESRRAKVQELADRPSGSPRARPQGHYIRGEGHLGEGASHGHQTKLHVRPFVPVEPPNGGHMETESETDAQKSKRGVFSKLFRR